MSAPTVAATADARFELTTVHVREAHRIIPGGANTLVKSDDQYPEGLVFATRDSSGDRSQGFRTVFVQELLRRRILAPSFVVSAAHDDDAIDQNVLAVEGALSAYERALDEVLETVLHGRPVKPTIRRRW